MANIFDQFDGGGNPFDQFDTAKAPVKIGAEAFPDVLRETLKGTDWEPATLRRRQAVENMWEGLKDAFGKGDKANIQANQVSRKKLR